MQDIGAPSYNATGSGLVPIQAGVGTLGMQWNQDIVYPSSITFAMLDGEATAESFLEFTLANISAELFGLLVSFQVSNSPTLKLSSTKTESHQ